MVPFRVAGGITLAGAFIPFMLLFYKRTYQPTEILQQDDERKKLLTWKQTFISSPRKHLSLQWHNLIFYEQEQYYSSSSRSVFCKGYKISTLKSKKNVHGWELGLFLKRLFVACLSEVVSFDLKSKQNFTRINKEHSKFLFRNRVNRTRPKGAFDSVPQQEYVRGGMFGVLKQQG